MKLITKLLTLFVAVFICSSHADENKQLFIGKIGEKAVFLLDVLEAGDLQNSMHISETGEVFIKVDQILALAKTEVSNFLATSQQLPTTNAFPETALRDNEPDVQCWNCKHWYGPRSCNGRKCPRCGAVN
jgi:Zn finger protein HypA/HybF involved in hydrogenase expression